MKYLVYSKGSAFFTEWFDVYNNFEDGMIVFDFSLYRFTTDGITWNEISADNL